jgi:hypothetical protein
MVLVFLFFGLPAFAKEPSPLEAVGNIQSIGNAAKPEDAIVLRKSGERVLARRYLLLFPGDRVQVAEGVEVCSNIAGSRRCFNRGTNGASIEAQQIGAHSSADDEYIFGLRFLFDTQRKPIVFFMNARGKSEICTPSPNNLLPAGDQKVPPTEQAVFVLWASCPSQLFLEDAVSKSVMDASNYTFAKVPIPGAEPVRIHAKSENVFWNVTRSNEVPTPPWLKAGPGPTSDAERLVRAIWILKEGPPTWHLFALSELADLSESNNFAASQLLIAAKSNELEAVLRSQ